ncbi:MAG: AMP-binding protein [Bacteroidales bacterium]|nr:AMP-binding protein [Bacteroidales bacterium]
MAENIVSFLDIFADTAKRFPLRPALTDFSTIEGGEGHTYTYGEWYKMILHLCGVFRGLGLRKGDHIAICGYNSANWTVSYFAVIAFGGIAVTLPHHLPLDEIAHLLDFSDSKALIADPFIYSNHFIGENIPVKISLKDFSIICGKKEGDSSPFSNFENNGLNQAAQICFSSGSTSAPKAIVLSLRNLSNNIKNAFDNLPNCHSNSTIAVLPLSHTYGLLGGVLCQIPNAHQSVFLGSDLSTENLIKSLALFQPYSLVLVPSIIESFYKRFGSKIKEILGENLQQLLIGGAAMNETIEDKILDLGIPLTVGYGTTETGPLIGANLWNNYKPHSCGRVVSGMEARISEAGEILVKGHNVMLGYYKNSEATRRKINADGWLHTGDRGWIDADGNIYVYGRLEQDMIVLPSGENVIPQDIEALLDRMDEVAESLVLERSGLLVALVFPKSDSEGRLPDKDTLLRAVNLRLPSFSQLADIEFVSEAFQRTGKAGIKRYLY